MNRRRIIIPVTLSAAALLVACGSDSPLSLPTSTTAPAAVTTGAADTTAPTDTASTGTGIASYADVQPAVLQFEGAGSFREPGGDTQAAGWSGSGFFISPDGLAVTNNHVITGAATLKVYAGGNREKSWNATVVGTSECNDLALVQVNVDGSVPYVDWGAEEIKPGLEIYVAGYPLGDPEYTLVKGIISKAEANGDTSWASIDHTVQFDAQSQPGNSGGPVVDTSGKVVAVAYAGGDPGTGTNQFFGINAHLAQGVIDKLRDGDFESIGINGKAVIADDGSFAGVWVSGVAAGAPASEAGVLPGDVVLNLNGLPVGQDGTMKDYCDVIRTAGSKPMTIQVLRNDTGELLSGEINGDKPLEVVQTFADSNSTDTIPAGGSTADGGYTFDSVTDDNGVILADVPVEWSARTTAPQQTDSGDVPTILAASDLQSFMNSYDAVGVQISAFAGVTPDAVMSAYLTDLPCTDVPAAAAISNSQLAGQGLLATGCGDTKGAIAIATMAPPDGSATILVFGQIQTQADLDAINRTLSSLVYMPGG